MSSQAIGVTYNPVAAFEDAKGVRRFTNAKLQSAIDDVINALPTDKHAAFVGHHVYEQNGDRIENVTTVSLYVRGPAGWTLGVAAYKDWAHDTQGAEAKIAKVF